MRPLPGVAGLTMLFAAAVVYYSWARSSVMSMTVAGSGNDVVRDRYVVIPAILSLLFFVLFRESIRYVRARSGAGGSPVVGRAVEFGALPLASSLFLLALPRLFVSSATEFRLSFDGHGVAGAAVFGGLFLLLKDAAARGLEDIGLGVGYEAGPVGAQRINFLNFPPTSHHDFLPLDVLGSILFVALGLVFFASL